MYRAQQYNLIALSKQGIASPLPSSVIAAGITMLNTGR